VAGLQPVWAFLEAGQIDFMWNSHRRSIQLYVYCSGGELAPLVAVAMQQAGLIDTDVLEYHTLLAAA
jgi:hypothetical protein